MTPAMPGEFHPAYADRVDVIRRSEGPVVLLAEYVGPLEAAADPSPYADVTVRERALRRERASFSLFPQYGTYVWDVWVDDLGRQVAGEHARWVENDLAFRLPPFGHGPLPTPDEILDGAAARIAERNREYLDGVLRDYLRGLAAFVVLAVVALLIGSFL